MLTRRTLHRLLFGALVLVVVSVIASASGRASQSATPTQFGVGLRVVRLIDRTRTIRLPSGKIEPRRLLTYVRYPARGRAAANDLVGVPAARSAGPFPLVVFAHGYAVTPAVYTRLLRAWTHAGYVVAAPVFPLESAGAPGGPDETDLVNEPADVSFVITQLLADSAVAGSPLSGIIDPSRIAVAGHSDGGEAVLAVAYDSRYRDPRVRAAIILSGAAIPYRRFRVPRASPPLLATQGSADTVNPPKFTRGFYAVARRPKFLLTLMGAAHLPPYSYQQPQLGVVERVTVAFLDRYVSEKGSLRRLVAAGIVPGVARLIADP